MPDFDQKAKINVQWIFCGKIKILFSLKLKVTLHLSIYPPTSYLPGCLSVRQSVYLNYFKFCTNVVRVLNRNIRAKLNINKVKINSRFGLAYLLLTTVGRTVPMYNYYIIKVIVVICSTSFVNSKNVKC